MYNAAVLEAKRQGYPGVFSGTHLLEPEKTARGLREFASIDFPFKGTRIAKDAKDVYNTVYDKILYETGGISKAKFEAQLMKDMAKDWKKAGVLNEFSAPYLLQLLVHGKSKIPAKSIFLDPKHFQEILKTNSFAGNKGFHYKDGGIINTYKNETRK